MNFYSIRRDLIEALTTKHYDEIKDASPIDRDYLVIDIADGYVPIYNSDLAECLADKPDLGFIEYGTHEVDNIFTIIQYNINQELTEVALEWLEEQDFETA